MNTKYLAAFFPVLACSASAFTIDFTGLGLSGTTITDSQVLELNVPGYGRVEFSTPSGQQVNVGTYFGDDAIEMPPNNTIFVRFLSGPVQNFSFTSVGLSTDEALIARSITATAAEIQMVNTGQDKIDGAGITSLSFDQSVPEPSTALLTSLSASLLLLRRRR